MSKLLTKIILLLVILGTLYLLSVFLKPEIARSIDSIIGVNGLSETIRGSKEQTDELITNMPSVEEFKSGAIDIQEKIVDGIHEAKDTIDTIRSGAQKAEDTYHEAKETYNSLKSTLSGATQKIGQIQGVVESVESITGSGVKF